jgi:quinol monooxygenase YgiN
MFGTVARVRVQPGHLQALKDVQLEWNETRNPKAIGAVASYVFHSDRDAEECTIVAIFRNRESYVANAAHPEQDAWYQMMRSHLQSDPEWVDGEVIAASTF